MTRLRPWQPLPHYVCEVCGGQATRRCCNSEPMIDLGVPTTTITVGMGDPTDIHYSCERHEYSIMDTHNLNMGENLRDGWSYYLTCQVFGLRWIGRIDTWLWNCGFETGWRGRLYDLTRGRKHPMQTISLD